MKETNGAAVGFLDPKRWRKSPKGFIPFAAYGAFVFSKIFRNEIIMELKLALSPSLSHDFDIEWCVIRESRVMTRMNISRMLHNNTSTSSFQVKCFFKRNQKKDHACSRKSGTHFKSLVFFSINHFDTFINYSVKWTFLKTFLEFIYQGLKWIKYNTFI